MDLKVREIPEEVESKRDLIKSIALKYGIEGIRLLMFTPADLPWFTASRIGRQRKCLSMSIYENGFISEILYRQLFKIQEASRFRYYFFIE